MTATKPPISYRPSRQNEADMPLLVEALGTSRNGFIDRAVTYYKRIARKRIKSAKKQNL